MPDEILDDDDLCCDECPADGYFTCKLPEGHHGYHVAASVMWVRDVDGLAYIPALDETGDETTSTVPMPAEDGNASERPNAGQHGDLYAESTDSIYVRDPADGLWIPWERSDGEAILDEELPDDAVPLHGEQHNVNDLREIGRQKSRADAAEAKLEEWTLRENDQARRAQAAEAKLVDAEKIRFEVEKILDDALGPNEEDGAGLGLAADVALLAARKKVAEAKLAETARRCTAFESALHQEVHTSEMAKRERDEALAKLDQVRGEIAKLDDWHGRRVDLPFVELMRMIVNPEAGQ